MGEYCDKITGDMSPVQTRSDGSSAHVFMKDSCLFAAGTLRRTEDLIDGELSLSAEEKFRLLDLLYETLKKDYADFESFISRNTLMKVKIDNLNRAYEKEEEEKRRHAIPWLIWIAFLACSAAACLYFSLR